MRPQRTKITVKALNLYYGKFHALKEICMDIPEHTVTAIIGPSGCGKSSLLRTFNRMNDLIPGSRVEGGVYLDDTSVYAKTTDVALLRKRVGMVFQKPNVFPKSIYDNVAIGPRRHGINNRRQLDAIVQRSLVSVALWDEVKDMLGCPGQSLAIGRQQRLCIARALAVEPDVILMDESCSALDPESIMKIEELIAALVKSYTIIIVTHSMEQARRISDMSAFMMIEKTEGGGHVGVLMDYTQTEQMFSRPGNKTIEDYITGRFG
ncbi:MAG: phosphate ABC transporter ATP-binding protein PstB [Oscillospiraceae bacterium]|jgi:phosphate transport system ATP-binding protein|nr:phosphate ABC transporter ATP-binding protein PstB [Oscillospiraceae bacterium]